MNTLIINWYPELGPQDELPFFMGGRLKAMAAVVSNFEKYIINIK
jgi:hypothetical protein